MKRKTFFKILFSSILLIIGSNSLKAQCWTLAWSDEFNGTKLNMDNWNIVVVGGGGGNTELQFNSDRQENIRLENGNLIIEARKENYWGKNYTSGRINTQKKKFWKYGRIEARMKLPYGKGMWPAFWMLAESINNISWPNCGEMDIMELIGGTGYNDQTVYTTFHWGPPLSNGDHPSYQKSFSLSNGKFADNFHVFALEWNETTATAFCDDNKYFKIDLSPATLNAFKENFFIVLNLAVGGDWPGGPDANTVFPQKMEIDYVRVYSGSGKPEINGPTEVVEGQTGVQYSLPLDTNVQYSWTVPDGVIITGNTTSNSITVDWGCESGTISCSLKTNCGINIIDVPVKIKKYEISGTSYFVTTSLTNQTFSVPNLSNSTYNWTVSNGLNISSGQGTNSISVNWGTTPGIVSLNVTNLCGSSIIERPMLAMGNYPYPNPLEPKTIPGTIWATDYNYGGEGVAYHDTDPANQGDGPRPTEGVDTQLGDGGTDIGWSGAGEWVTYTVKAEKAGDYFLELRTSSLSGGGSLSIFIDGVEKYSNISIPSTGAWNSYTSIYPGFITFAANQVVIKLQIINAGFNISKMIFTPKQIKAPTNITGQAGTTSINLSWNASTDNQQIAGYKISVNGILITQVTTNSYLLTDLTPNTKYTIEIVTVDLQGNTSLPASAEITSLANDEISDIKINPNPTNSILYVNGLNPNAVILIIDINGKTVLSKQITDNKIDVSNLANGIYNIKISDKSGEITKKFIKQ